MIVLIVRDFFKVAIFAYAAVISTADLFKVKNYRQFVLPIGIMIFLSSMFSTDNFVEHIEQRKLVLNSIFPLFEFVTPFMLFIVLLIQKYILNSSNLLIGIYKFLYLLRKLEYMANDMAVDKELSLTCY